MLPTDKNKHAIQVFNPDGIVAVSAGELNVEDYQAVAFSVDNSFALDSGGLEMPIKAGDVLGVTGRPVIYITTACNMAFME
jgi:hypothetical protein